jgi:hypothetical protein
MPDDPYGGDILLWFQSQTTLLHRAWRTDEWVSRDRMAEVLADMSALQHSSVADATCAAADLSS